MHRLFWVLALAWPASACGTSPTQVPASGVHQAVIELNDESRFDLPVVAKVDQPFEITIYTWSGVGLGRTVAETRVSRTDRGILIEPFDEYFSEDPAIAVPDRIARKVTVSFEESGTRWFEIRGRAMPGFQEVVHRFSLRVMPSS